MIASLLSGHALLLLGLLADLLLQPATAQQNKRVRFKNPGPVSVSVKVYETVKPLLLGPFRSAVHIGQCLSRGPVLLQCRAEPGRALASPLTPPARSLLSDHKTSSCSYGGSPHIQSRFRFRDPMLFQAKARLTDDAIELTGWHWRGRYSRRLSLSEILHADAKTNRDLVLWLADGEVVRLRLEHALRWQDALIDRLPGPNYTTNDP